MYFKKNQKCWNGPKKLLARKNTIIDQYRYLFEQQVPSNQQYWAMCGQCSTPDNKFQEGCELDQVLKTGLIQPEQFNGVDCKEIIKGNRKAFPKAKWHIGDFYQTMIKAKAESNFNPAIVNADMVTMPDRACGYLADIINLLSSCNNVMIVANMVFEFHRFPDRNRDIEFVIEQLNKQPQLQSALYRADWKFDKNYYPYAGTGSKSKSVMGSIIIYKFK